MKLAIVIALAAIIGIGVMLAPAPAPDPEVAVFGRTLRPTPPPIINKRTSLSGEGEFVLPLNVSDIKTDKVETFMVYRNPNSVNATQKADSLGEADAVKYAAANWR